MSGLENTGTETGNFWE